MWYILKNFIKNVIIFTRSANEPPKHKILHKENWSRAGGV